jgi:Cu-Zn family superoxide dismutase
MRLASLIVLLCACASTSSSAPPAGGPAATGGAAAAAAPDAGTSSGAGASAQPPSVATAVLEPRSGSNASGSARLTPSPSGVAVLVEVKNATPGEHGVHIHEKGDCSDPAANNAGAHFNPNSAAHHGGPSTPVRHGGDLGNINIDASGRGLLVITVGDLSMDNVVGRSLLVHEKADDLRTDPAGNSGARIACGVIQPQAGGR